MFQRMGHQDFLSCGFFFIPFTSSAHHLPAGRSKLLMLVWDGVWAPNSNNTKKGFLWAGKDEWPPAMLCRVFFSSSSVLCRVTEKQWRIKYFYVADAEKELPNVCTHLVWRQKTDKRANKMVFGILPWSCFLFSAFCVDVWEQCVHERVVSLWINALFCRR